MKTIKDGIFAFTRDDHIISFDTREEYDNASIADLNINHIFATPADMVRKYREMEDTLEGDGMEDKIIEACIRSALDVMKLNVVNIDVNYNSDGTKDFDVVIDKKQSKVEDDDHNY